MNANELADELENVDEGSGYLGVLSLEASTMLRQQQAAPAQRHRRRAPMAGMGITITMVAGALHRRWI